MKYFCLILLFLGLLPSAFADCYPIRNIMSPAARQDFQRLCRAAVSCDPACQGIEPSKLINCSGTQASNGLFAGGNIGRRLLSCARAFFVDSMVDLANTIIELIKTLVGATINSATNIIRFMTDSDFRQRAMSRGAGMSALASSFLTSAVRNFSREYTANFRAAVGRVGLLQAPLAAIGETLLQPFLRMVVDVVQQIAESQISQFRCLNAQAKLDSLCAMAGGFIMPPAVFFSVLKNGAMALRGSRAAETFMAAARRTFAARTRAPRPPALTVGRAAPTPARVARPPARPRVEPVARPRPEARRPVADPPARERGGDPNGGLIDTPEEVIEATEGLVEGAGLLDDAASIADDVADALASDRFDTPELRRIGALADDARISEAETLLGRALTADERSAILEAHYIGLRGSDGLSLPPELARGFGTYTLADLRQKALLLRQVGFDRAQIRLLMERGIAGAPAAGDALVDDIARSFAAREAAIAGNPEAIRYVREGNRLVESEGVRNLALDSYAAARGSLRVARESTGDAARVAAARAVEAATTSGDPELIVEAARVYQSAGGDVALLIRSNSERLTQAERLFQADPLNAALRNEVITRRQLSRTLDPTPPAPVRVEPAPARVEPAPARVEPAPARVEPAPARVEPAPARINVRDIQRLSGEFVSDGAKRRFLESVRDGGEVSAELLRAAARGDNPQLFIPINETIERFFTGSFYPDVARAYGKTSLSAAEELAALQRLNRNFFQLEVTTNSGVTRTLTEEYSSRAYGGNWSRFSTARRNLENRIRELGGTP